MRCALECDARGAAAPLTCFFRWRAGKNAGRAPSRFSYAQLVRGSSFRRTTSPKFEDRNASRVFVLQSSFSFFSEEAFDALRSHVQTVRVRVRVVSRATKRGSFSPPCRKTGRFPHRLKAAAQDRSFRGRLGRLARSGRSSTKKQLGAASESPASAGASHPLSSNTSSRFFRTSSRSATPTFTWSSTPRARISPRASSTPRPSATTSTAASSSTWASAAASSASRRR